MATFDNSVRRSVTLATERSRTARNLFHTFDGSHQASLCSDRKVTPDRTQNDGPRIEIKVVDEKRGVTKVFFCERGLLLRKMRYFCSQIPKQEGHYEVTIHCDAQVFEWILRYARFPRQQTQRISTSNVVSILVSSHFLQVPELDQECLKFIARHFDEVNALNIDFSSLQDCLLVKLAGEVPLLKLLGSRQRVNKLVTSLLQKRVAFILQPAERRSSLRELLKKDTQDRNALSEGLEKFPGWEREIKKCKWCGKLMSQQLMEQGVCRSSQIRIQYRGNAHHRHQPHDAFSQSQLQSLFFEGNLTSWKPVFWSLWALKQMFNCTRCGQWFSGMELMGCSFHPEPPSFPQSQNSGSYPCCGVSAFKFHPFSPKAQGCKHRPHSLAPYDPNKRIFEHIAANWHFISSTDYESSGSQNFAQPDGFNSYVDLLAYRSNEKGISSQKQFTNSYYSPTVTRERNKVKRSIQALSLVLRDIEKEHIPQHQESLFLKNHSAFKDKISIQEQGLKEKKTKQDTEIGGGTTKRSSLNRKGSIPKSKRLPRRPLSQVVKSDVLRRSDSASMENLIQSLKKQRGNEERGVVGAISRVVVKT